MYALVHYPHIELHDIQRFRQQHDPQFHLIAPHITLLFPVPDCLGEQALVHHIEQVLRSWQPFEISLGDVQTAWDDALYLLVQEGKETLVQLHDEIYTGILQAYLRADLPYIPHVTLGKAGPRPDLLEQARRLGITARCRLNALHLVQVNDERSKIVWSRVFHLGQP